MNINVTSSDFQGSDYKEPTKTVTVNVLASDFDNNYHMNLARDLKGCPIIRALERAGVDVGEGYSMTQVAEADMKVLDMFNDKLPIEDFSFEITL